MPRLFVGIDLPEVIDQQLLLMQAGIPGARWESEDKLHVTLKFIGDVDGGTARRVEEALRGIEIPRFELGLRGVGVFPPRGRPRILWAGIEDSDDLLRLHALIERELESVGIERERRNYHPHVTLARLRNSPEKRVAGFVTQHALLSTPAFPVEAFQLYSSVLNPKGSRYKVEADFTTSA
jgi:2'-5' RNA ligase